MNFFTALLRHVLKKKLTQTERTKIIKELKIKRNLARIEIGGFNRIMRTYLIEYIDPRTQMRSATHLDAEDKTGARDLFFETFPAVEEVEKITCVPVTKA